ncbi:MAG: T9SS type A sorting domain-containing protein [Ignavibacteriae bacterium]|nr:T9SS type A sorting domain-containing protein [Ignavibacteriota bacterium]
MKKVSVFLLFLMLVFASNTIFSQIPVVSSPDNQQVLEGEVATFSVTLIGGLQPVTYQWQATFDQNASNFANIPGAMSSSYSTSPTTLSMDGGWYRCAVTNDSGTTYSNYAVLSVEPIVSPTITSHPSNQNINIGEAATFSVSATGTLPLQYQWYANSILIPGATLSTYTTDIINDIEFDGTTIYCIVTNIGGSKQSNAATLNVSYENARITDGLQVLYNFKEGSGDIVYDESGVGTPLNLTISNPTKVIWTNKGLNVYTENRIKSTSVASKIINSCVTSNEMTFEAWFIPTDMVQRSVYARIMTMTNTSKSTSNIKLDQLGTNYNFHVRTVSTGLNGDEFTNINNAQKLIHYVATKNAAGNVRIYLNGTKVVDELLSGNFSNWDPGYYLYLGSDAENNVFWQGTFYLTAIYSRSLSESEINQNYFFGVESDIFPLITAQPTDVLLKPTGQTATFSVTAIGNAPISYQWYRNNGLISGATSSTYTTPILTLGYNNNTYKCIISSPDGSIESNSALLTITEPDVRITQDIIAQYTFTEGSGSIINDVSGVGEPIDLVINTPEAINWIQNGLEINSEANIFSTSAASKIYEMCTSTNQLTIETWIKPANKTQNYPSRIVTYSQDGLARNVSLSQEADQYSGRLRTSVTTTNASPYVVSLNSPVEEKPQHVVYVFREDGVAIIFVNGVEKVRKTIGGDFSTWTDSYRLGIANEVIDSRPWLGTFNYLAIFNRRLTSEEVLHNYEIGPYGVEVGVNAPSDLVSSANEVGKISLSWTDNATNEDSYIIERSEVVPQVWSDIDTLSSNTVNFIDSNILEGRNYTYRVKVTNSFLDIDTIYSNETTVISLIKNPAGLVGKADQLGQINLSWTDNSNGENGFNIERTLGEVEPFVYTVVGSVGPNITTYDDFGIEEGVIYAYRINAFTEFISSNNSNVMSLRSKASFINAPTDLAIELDPIYGQPVLNWTDNAFNENGFIIERRLVTIGSIFSVIDSVGADITTYTDLTVTDSTSYIYRVFAFNDEYISDKSSEIYIDVLVGVEEENIPNEFGLLQNYPNPFNPSTTFAFNLPKESNVILTIYNLIGQKIQVVTENNYSAGRHEILFDASNLTSGIYLYSIKAISNTGEKFIQTKKFILLK